MTDFCPGNLQQGADLARAADQHQDFLAFAARFPHVIILKHLGEACHNPGSLNPTCPPPSDGEFVHLVFFPEFSYCAIQELDIE